MFGLSLGKIAALIIVIFAVWMVFRWLQRAHQIRDAGTRRSRVGSISAEQTVRCASCGVFIIARTAGDCGRAGCPFAKAEARSR
jgi:hypothetical protein